MPSFEDYVNITSSDPYRAHEEWRRNTKGGSRHVNRDSWRTGGGKSWAALSSQMTVADLERHEAVSGLSDEVLMSLYLLGVSGGMGTLLSVLGVPSDIIPDIVQESMIIYDDMDVIGPLRSIIEARATGRHDHASGAISSSNTGVEDLVDFIRDVALFAVARGRIDKWGQ